MANTTRESGHLINQPGLPAESRPLKNSPGPGYYDNHEKSGFNGKVIQKRARQFKFDRAGRDAIVGMEQPGLPNKSTKNTLENPGPQYQTGKPISLPTNDKIGRRVHKTATFTSFGGPMAKMTRDHGRLMVQPDLPLYSGSQKGPGPGAYDHYSPMKSAKGKKGKKDGKEEQETDHNGKPIRRKKNFGDAKTSNLEGMSGKPRTVAAKFGTTKRFFTMDHSDAERPGPGDYDLNEGGYDNFGSSSVNLSKSVPVFKMTGRPSHEVSVQNQTAGLIIHRTVHHRPSTAPEPLDMTAKGKTGDPKDAAAETPKKSKKAKVKVGSAMHDDRGGVLDTKVDAFKKSYSKAPVAAFGKSKRFVEARAGVVSPGLPQGPAYTRDSVKRDSPAADKYAPRLNMLGNKNVSNKPPSSSFGGSHGKLTRTKANYVVSVGTPANQIMSRDIYNGTQPGPATYDLPHGDKTKQGTARENYSTGKYGSSIMGRSTRTQAQGICQPGMPSVVSRGVAETPGPNHYGDEGGNAADNGITQRQSKLSTKKRAPISGFGGSMGKMTRDHTLRMVQPGLPQRNVSHTPGPGAYDHKESNSAMMAQRKSGAYKEKGKKGQKKGGKDAEGEKGARGRGTGASVNANVAGMETSSTFNRASTATFGKFDNRGNAGFAVVNPGLPVKQTKAMADNPGPGIRVRTTSLLHPPHLYPHYILVARYSCVTRRRIRSPLFSREAASVNAENWPPLPFRQRETATGPG
jgi:hypothetical protein